MGGLTTFPLATELLILQMHDLKVQYLYAQIKNLGLAKLRTGMQIDEVTLNDFLSDRQGRTFADIANDSEQPFDTVLEFFADPDRQRRMEEAELHHDRPPLAGVVRELETQPAIDAFLSGSQVRRNTRFRQAIGVVVRIVMERRGWRKTGRKGSLGVRAKRSTGSPAHNTGGLAFWFVRAERYERSDGMPYKSVRERCRALQDATPRRPRNGKKKDVRP